MNHVGPVYMNLDSHQRLIALVGRRKNLGKNLRKNLGKHRDVVFVI